jgi:outer membrane protein insertion porin family
MICSRRQRLAAAFVCLCSILGLAQGAQQSPPAPQQKSPFEAVKPAPEPPKPQAPKPQVPSPFEVPKPAEEVPPPATPENVIEAIEFRGSRRLPQATLRAMIFSKKGDTVDEETLRRDFMAIWNTGRYDDIRLEIEPGQTGQIVRFVLVERQIVRTIKYEGVKSVTVSEILERFQERRVGLSVESQYEPNRVQRAKVVLEEFLAERGRQFAEVEPEIQRIPPSSLAVTFRVKEGPKVKVGKIDIQGNKVFGDRRVIRAMKSLRPIGIPHSLLFESLFSKSYDSSKLEIDKEMIRNFYQERGYFMARALDHTVTMRDVGGGWFRIPLFYPNKRSKRVDLEVPVEEGRRYRLNKINFVGMKFFRTPDVLADELFQMSEGDIFSTDKLRKGMDEMRKLYGNFGFIDFVPEPYPEVIPGTDKINLRFDIDEGKQFFVRRIDFTGNTTTRDKVIRRELLIDEGQLFSTRMWELSVLRLNQLGYFEMLKEEEAADIKRDSRTNTVDITLQVKERGKNSVGLQGGVSGIAGSFVGFNYSTNNFLGLGETLSIDSQLGDRIRAVTFGFTEPYFLDRPIQLGFTVYTQRFNFDQGREVSLLSGRNLLPLFDAVGQDNLLNYVSNGFGFTVHTSYPLKRSFARLGLTYGYDVSDITTLSTASQQYFEFLNFQGLGGPNSLSGIRTSKIIPSYSYNTVNHPMTPTAGRSLFMATEFSGSILGGNVNMIRPTISTTYYRRGLKKSHVIGMRGMGSFLSGYGGKLAPPFSRFYMGGEQDVRGFDIWGISPIAFVPSEATISVLNDDGSARTQKVIVDGLERFVPVTMSVPVYQFIFPGGDTQVVGNAEYRIPIVGPVTLAGFFDVGLNKIVRRGQLALNPSRTGQLNSRFPQAGFDGKALVVPGTQRIRTSTGVELQILMPVVNAPFRIYWAYNPTILRQAMQPPIVLDRSAFPNQATFFNAVARHGQPIRWFEKRRTFRFSIGRTF